MAGSSQANTLKTKKSNDNGGNGLLLYHYYSSHFSKKVVFVLNEKKLKYKSRIVDLYHGEQFEPWFLKLNPKSEVPVLKDGVKVIPDSKRIIDYLEDNFSNGNTPRLIPEKGSTQFQTMERMRDLLDNIPMAVVTFGCIMNPTLTGKMNMCPQELKARQNIYTLQESLLTDLCEKHKDFRDYYLVKKSNLERMKAMVMDPNEVEKALLDLDYALKEMEKQLQTHDGKKWWLCGEQFTLADISLCLVLHRAQQLGLMHRFPEAHFPHLHDYYRRGQQREAFQKTVQQGPSLLNALSGLDTRERLLVGVGGVALVAAALFFLHRHK